MRQLNLNIVKIIFKKEFKENIDLKYLKRILLILFLIPAIILITAGKGEGYGVESFIFLTPVFSGIFFYVFSFQFLQRRFFEVKAINGFQPLLVLPITIKEIWFANFLSIITASYLLILIMNVLILISGVIKLGIVFLTVFSLKNIILSFINPMIISAVIIISSYVVLRFKDHRTIEYFNTALMVGLILGFTAVPKFNWFSKINMDLVAIIGLILAIIIDIIFYCLIGRIKKEML